MNSKFPKKPIVLALGAVVVAAAGAGAGAIFVAKDLPSGYRQPAEHKPTEGKCGAEAFKKMDRDGDDKLTLDEFLAGQKPAAKKSAEGKCGEGTCGEGKCGGTK